MPTTVPTLPLPPARPIPQLGYGVFKVEPEVAEDVTAQALSAGYRHLDTATAYRNEDGVGRAIAASGIAREDLFVTTKLWNDAHAFDDAIAACEASLERLGLEYVDLYLVHWAVPSQGKYVEAWKALIALQERGLVRAIGVSNYPRPQLEEIIDATGVAPAIHQIELHPYFQQRELREVHERHGILTEAWGPLGQGKSDLLENATITGIAEAHGASPAQVVLAWHLAHGIVTIPKSVTPSRIVENLAAVELQLAAEEVAAIDELDRPDGRGGADPATKTARSRPAHARSPFPHRLPSRCDGTVSRAGAAAARRQPSRRCGNSPSAEPALRHRLPNRRCGSASTNA